MGEKLRQLELGFADPLVKLRSSIVLLSHKRWFTNEEIIQQST